MNTDKQIDEMAKAKKCNTCIHNAVCQELEEFRDPLGWVNTEGEFVCSYYDKASEVAAEIFAELEKIANMNYETPLDTWVTIRKSLFSELKKKYTEGEG